MSGDDKPVMSFNARWANDTQHLFIGLKRIIKFMFICPKQIKAFLTIASKSCDPVTWTPLCSSSNCISPKPGVHLQCSFNHRVSSLRPPPHQRGRGQDRLLHRDRRHARAHEAREVSGHLRPRDVHASPAELHGPDGRPVHLHPRSLAGGRHLRQHRGAGTEPVRPHPEANPAPARRDGHRYGVGVQGNG